MIYAILYALWCGICWWLRGGKLGVIWRALFNREPGTTVTRLSCAILMAAPLGFFAPTYALLAVSIYAAMTIGYFGESMGLERLRDYPLLAVWGFVVCLVMLLPFAYFDWRYTLAYSTWGSFAMLAYAVNKDIGYRFGLDWTERAELMTGAIFGAALWSAAWL